MTDMPESPDRSTSTRNTRSSNIAAPQSPRRIAIDAKPWHSLELRQLIGDLGTGTEGLTDQEARGRFEKYGPNRLPEVEPPTWWGILLRQFYNPLILILGVAAAFAIAIGDVEDAVFIAVVMGLNSLIGGYQEWRAEKSSRALQKMLHVRATVSREGTNKEIDSEEVVPGDLVYLESGNRVPADLRLVFDQALQIDESLLTGESVSVAKDAAWRGEPTTPIADRKNMAFAGSVVTRGRGRGVVVDTGTATVVGQVAEAVTAADDANAPLVRRMEGFSRTVAAVVTVIAVVLGLAGLAIHGLDNLQTIFLFAIALAVAAIPEGLPAALTVALAVATSRMAKRRVIVRRLAAVEGLGSCTLVASDKTGTLTRNELTVRVVVLPGGERLEVTGDGFEPVGEVRLGDVRISSGDVPGLAELLRAGVLCNEADLYPHDGTWHWRGDPTDIAMLSLAQKLGESRDDHVSRQPQFNEIPFEAEHRYAATYHRDGDATWVYVKGAPERVLAMCDIEPLHQRRLQETAEGLAAEGYRVLALAAAMSDGRSTGEVIDGDPRGLRLVGFIGMYDPLRSGVKDAIESCHEAGIRVCMITGDHPITATAVARELGIDRANAGAITGSELEGVSDENVDTLLRRYSVFARVSPQQKLSLVKSAQRLGHFVAVTGDGVNDAPALRAANIGVAMGKMGTDIAREAAELVISDDDFSSLVGGIEEGRVAYDNVRKVVAHLTATGTAEVLLVCLALTASALMTFFGMQVGGNEGAGPALLLPLLPVQLLWLNLVTDGLQGVALAFEPSEGDVLRRGPRPPSEPIFNRLMIEQTLLAAGVMALVSFGVYLWGTMRGMSPASVSNLVLLMLVLFENVQVGNNRSETKSAFAFSPLRSPYLLVGVIAALIVHVLGMNLPILRDVLKTEPVSLATWATLIPLALTVLLAMEIHKWSWAKRYPTAVSTRHPNDMSTRHPNDVSTPKPDNALRG